MNKITLENINQVEFKNKTVEYWQLLLEFILLLAEITKLKSSDILEFLEINKEKDPKKIQLKAIAEQYAFFTDEEKALSKNDDQFSHFDFNKIETYSNEYLEKLKRLEEFENKFLVFFQSLNKSDGIYKRGVELISFVTGISQEILFETDFVILCELFKRAAIIPEEETVKGFFFMKAVKTVLTNTTLLNFIKIVNKITQKK